MPNRGISQLFLLLTARGKIDAISAFAGSESR